uniref:Major facilitator superfamily (MFS) profile domain-containing protein n=1 Tax=Brassica oleracea var. oleracea TaxID=109376 RepID=A0A0D3C4G9_BRAOL
MVGAIPAAMTYYSRSKMPETARYTALVAKDVKQAASDMSRVLQVQIETEKQEVETKEFSLFPKEFMKRHGLHLLGTTSTWFLLDIAFFSQNLFQKDIYSAIGWIPPAQTMNEIQEVFKIACAQTIIALCSAVPGYWFTVAFIDENRIGFVIMYSLTFFFANFGPNATTFIVPAEIFPARFRSTCHGISAASGKVGAIVGAFGFLYLSQSPDKDKTDAGYPPGTGVRNSLIVLGVVNFLVFSSLSWCLKLRESRLRKCRVKMKTTKLERSQ